MDYCLKRILLLIENKYKNDYEFENDFGLARSTVSAWRKGKLKSYNKRIYDIAEFFNVSSDFLLGTEQKNKAISDETEKALDLFMKLNDEKRNLIIEMMKNLK